MKRIFNLVATLVLLFASVNFLHAQGITTGSITGTVADPTGAVIPGATITATATATKITSTATAGKDGTFSFKDLPIGVYTVVINANGFSNLTLNNIEVSAAKQQGLGIEKLSTGSASAVVDVSDAANILETSQAQVTTTFDSQAVTSLPLAGGFDEVTLLIPGVVNTRSDNFSNTNGTGFSVNGERGRANNFEIDGVTNNDTTIAGPQVFFGNDEALAEVQVITNSFSAQYGRNAGSVVNYITKSGTNQIHGSAIYKYSGDFTSSLEQGYSKGPQFGFCAPGQTPSADNCNAPVVPRYVNNYYGGTLGVPLIKDKLFAFGSTYWYKNREFGSLTSSTPALYPDAASLSALAAAFPNNASVAILQQLSPFNVPGGNPRTLPFSNPKNLPNCNNVGCAETVTANGTSVPITLTPFGRQIPSLSSDQEDLGRIDWQATQKDHIFLRYLYQSNPTTPYSDVANGGFADVTDITHSVGADITHTFGPHWVNQLRYAFQQSKLAFDGGGYPNCTITNFINCPSSVSIGAFADGTAFTGLGLSASFPQGRIVKVGQLQDNAIWTIGKHSITFGGEFDDTHAPNVFLPYVNGSINFDNLSDFIAGGCANSNACYDNVAKGSPNIPFVEYDAAAYLQDDWKVSPSLTLNLGLRWEFFGEPLNGVHNSTAAVQEGPNPIWDPTLPLSETTATKINYRYKNFEPRIGFAYNPVGNNRLVVRGAYAINYEPQYQNIVLNVAQSAPAVIAGGFNCNAGTTNCIPTGGATQATAQAQLATQLPFGYSPGYDTQQTAPANFRFPVGQTYTLGVQYQIRNSAVVEVRYVGNHTSSQFQSLDANPDLASVSAAFPNVVNPSSICTPATSTLTLNGADVGYLHCGATAVDQVANTGFSQYQSLQTDITTHNYHGLTATLGYTWSHNIDNTDEVYSTGGGGNSIAYSQNPLNTDVAERANSSLDIPNVFSLGLVYQFPNLHTGHDITNKLVGGWQLSTIYLYSSGQPYTDYQGVTNQTPASNTGAFDPKTGAQLLPGDPRTEQSYGDPALEDDILGLDPSRLIISNPKASPKTLGIWTDVTLGVDGAGNPIFSGPILAQAGSPNNNDGTSTLVPTTPSQVHYIVNNQLAANIYNNPYPGGPRHDLRGDTTNNVDLSVQKNTKITEHVTFRLQVDAFNILNRGYYGTPGNDVSDIGQGNFNNFYYNYGGGSPNLNTPGTGQRNLLFTGKILF
jgi:hypothetical protein